MKKALASVLAVLMLLMCIPLGAVSVSAASSMNTTYRNSKGYEFAIFPVGPNFHISQTWYGSYSHGNQIAVDCLPLTTSGGVDYSAKLYAPFTGKIVASYSSWGCVVFQSNEPVQYADGTVDIMTVVFGHDNKSEQYAKNVTIKQGQPLCAPGTAGGYAYHTHIFVVKGTWQAWCNGGYKAAGQTYVNSGGGNVVPTDAFFFDTEWSRDWTQTSASCYYPDNKVNWISLYSEKAQNYAQNNHIAEPYNSHCVVKVTNASTIKSLPCSKDTDPNSADVESVKVGDEYETIALYRNDTKTGNLWYKVKTKSGGTGYLFAGNTKFVKLLTDDVTVKNPVSPASIDKGKSFIIGGTISSTYQTITRVQAWVTSPGAFEDYLYGHDDNLSVASYNLSGSPVDNMLKFGTLDVGIYQYRVRVRVDSYYAKDATTTATVYNDELYLEDCGSIFFVLDPSCSHSYNSTVKNPTCTEGGYTTYTCTLCGYAYDDNHTNALGCDFATEVTKPSCNGQGYTTSVCRRCGKTETGNYVDPTGHMYDILEIPATCTQPGKRCYTCAFCGDYYEETVTSYVSEWSTEYPDVDDSAIIESKQQYRWRTEEWTESAASSLSGWTLSDSYTRWGEYGAWSDWGNDAISGNDATQVETRTAYTYYYYKCPGCGAHMHGWGITCPTWAGGCGKATIRSSDYVWVYSTTSYSAAGLKDFYGTGKYYATVDGMVAFQHDKGQVTQYRSRIRALETVYRFYRYSDWTEWSDTYDASAFQMEERTVYRYILAQTARHTYSGQVTTAATCGADGVMTYTCIACGDSYTETIPATGNHVYDDDYDADCNGCGSIREVPEKPPVTPDLPEDAPAFVVDTVTACAGEEITVAIRTQRNSGIVSMRLEVAYDADVLELISLEEGDFVNVIYSPTSKNPFIINWVDAINPNNTTDGVIVLATFRVKEGAPIGQTAITINYDPEDVYDQNYDNVAFRVENGYVEVVDYVLGDVNDDGRINNKDLGLLQQYLAGFDVTVNTKAADVNADNRVNNKDLGLLQQYLAGFEVELG